MFDPRQQTRCGLRHGVGGFDQRGKLRVVEFSERSDDMIQIGGRRIILRRRSEPNTKPHDNRGASQDRHIAVASFRCVTATCAGRWSPASG
jgi:hypothetical protein